mmetsp:Transcript_15102/g.31808  ORF Transcript_15102/g.31808 Transcript_15102/m.31808 type:complete len:844 (-) Transcript_15102:311-2842(-)
MLSLSPDIVLEQYVRGRRFVDLHSHLLGMGDDYFWIDSVMRYHLVQRLKKEEHRFAGPQLFPDGSDETPEEQPATLGRKKQGSKVRLNLALKQLHFNHTKDADEFIRAFVENAKGKEDQRKSFSEHLQSADKNELEGAFDVKTVSKMLDKYFTCDAVYSLEALNTAFGFPKVIDFNEPERTREVQMRNVNYKLNYLLKKDVRHYIRFNARKRTLSSVIGVTNYDLAKHLQGANLHALYGEQERPSHVLQPRGAALLRKALSEAFCMHSVEYGFTPHFYPRRFLLKDAMYEASLDVLSVLLNHISWQYDQNGVCYAELSIGASDALNPDIWYYLVNETFRRSSLDPANVYRRKGTDGDEDEPQCEEPDTDEDEEKDGEEEEPKDGEAEPTGDAKGDAAKKYAAKKKKQRKTPTQYYGIQLNNVSACVNKKPSGFFVGFLAGFSRNCKSSGDENQLELADEDSRALAKLEGEFQEFLLHEFLLHENMPAELSEGMINQMREYVRRKIDDARQAVVTRFGQGVEDQLTKLWQTIDRPEPVQTATAQRQMDPDVALKYYLSNYLVGLDAFGDEYAQPWTPLIHPMAIAIVEKVMQNPISNFGIRIHALERVPEKGLRRPNANSHPWGATAYHLVTTFESLQKIQNRLKQLSTPDDTPDDTPEPHDPPPSKRRKSSKAQGSSNTQGPRAPSRLRIGHGTYLKRRTGLCDPLLQLLNDMRDWVKDESVVLEVCPTSNHCLVNDTGVGSNNVPDMLRVLMESCFDNEDPSKMMRFVLATDDDGIFPIQPCIEHNRHRSVAHEYCVAMNGQLTQRWFQGDTAAQHIETLVRIAQQAAFQCRKVYREWEWRE